MNDGDANPARVETRQPPQPPRNTANPLAQAEEFLAAHDDRRIKDLALELQDIRRRYAAETAVPGS